MTADIQLFVVLFLVAASAVWVLRSTWAGVRAASASKGGCGGCNACGGCGTRED